MFDVERLNGIRNIIDSDAKKTLVKALILSKLDYCNILYALTPRYIVKKLQCALNASIQIYL